MRLDQRQLLSIAARVIPAACACGSVTHSIDPQVRDGFVTITCAGCASCNRFSVLGLGLVARTPDATAN